MRQNKTLALILTLALISSLALAGCAGQGTPGESVPPQQPQQEDAAPRTITVSGSAGLEATPDVARITIGVTTRGDTPGEAREGNSASVNATLAALAELGIEEKDIQTSDMDLRTTYGAYDYDNETPTGYRMNTRLTIYLREIDRVGEVVDAVIDAGTNALNGVDYLLSNQDELYNRALNNAIGLARAKAEEMAATAGKKVGEVVSITETSEAVATVSDANPDSGGWDNTTTTTVRPGRTTVSSQVQVVYTLVD